MKLMQRLKAKIHLARVTQARTDYIGSLAVDTDLLEAVALEPGELVQVWDVDNGERFETYVIPAPPGSGEVAVYGAAAHKVEVGDRLIIAAFVLSDEWIEPQMVLVNAQNRIVERLPFQAQPYPAELS